MCETETPYIWRLQACITIVSVAQKVSLHRSTVGPGHLAGGWVSGSEKRLRLRVNVLSLTHPPWEKWSRAYCAQVRCSDFPGTLAILDTNGQQYSNEVH